MATALLVAAAIAAALNGRMPLPRVAVVARAPPPRMVVSDADPLDPNKDDLYAILGCERGANRESPACKPLSLLRLSAF